MLLPLVKTVRYEILDGTQPAQRMIATEHIADTPTRAEPTTELDWVQVRRTGGGRPSTPAPHLGILNNDFGLRLYVCLCRF